MTKSARRTATARKIEDPPEPETGGPDDESTDQGEVYWQAAYCAALRSLAGYLGKATLDDPTTNTVIEFAAACADAALEHAFIVDDDAPRAASQDDEEPEGVH